MSKNDTTNQKVITTTDLGFRKVFSNTENKHILIGFINDVLNFNISDLIIENTYNIKSFYDENNNPKLRYTQVDALARLSNGSLVTIEMQLRPQAIFRERVKYYINEQYNANYDRAELSSISGQSKFSSLRPVYSINILNYIEFKDDENAIHRILEMDMDTHQIYVGYDGIPLEIKVFIELKKNSTKLSK